MKSGAARHPITAFPAEASHLEMVQIAPRLQRLDFLLQVSQPCVPCMKQMVVVATVTLLMMTCHDTLVHCILASLWPWSFSHARSQKVMSCSHAC